MLPEPGKWVFERAEHEWARLAALADPNWDVLRDIGRLVGHWRAVWSVPQIDGLLCWRLLDRRMDGVVPEEEQHACRGHLEWLEAGQKVYREDLALLLDALERTGLVWVTDGGPVQYAALGVDCWPRRWREIDLSFADAHRQELESVLSDALGLPFSVEELVWRVRLPGGTRVSIESPRPPDVPVYDWGTWDRFAGRRKVQAQGLDWWVPSEEVLVLCWAYSTWLAVSEGYPLPLWALARLANARPDWEVVAKLLRADIEAHAARGNPDPTDPEEMLAVTYEPNRSHEAVTAQRALWTLDVAQRVYGLPGLGSVDALIAPHRRWQCTMLSEGAEHIRRHYPEEDFPGAPTDKTDWPTVKSEAGVTRYYICEWARWPGDEDFIFEDQRYLGMAARVREGVWRVVHDPR